MAYSAYEEKIIQELEAWQEEMFLETNVANSLQQKLNSFIPEEVPQAIAAAIQQWAWHALFRIKQKSTQQSTLSSLEEKETLILERIACYQEMAATGAGTDILFSLAGFPHLLDIQLNMLCEIATHYGYSVEDYRERLFLLHIFQLTFSRQQQRSQVYLQMVDWETQKQYMPAAIQLFDWPTFQQGYLDYIDRTKLAQIIPVVSAPVGAMVNYHLLQKVGVTAMNAYRMRWQETSAPKI